MENEKGNTKEQKKEAVKVVKTGRYEPYPQPLFTRILTLINPPEIPQKVLAKPIVVHVFVFTVECWLHHFEALF